MSRKLKLGIDINEVFRSRSFQFDKFFVEEFGEAGLPKEQSYVYDFFKYYKFEDKVEITKELKEPDEMPEDINPLDYQYDEKLKEAPADAFLFKAAEKKVIPAREVYNRFMFEDYVFEIHGSAPVMYRNMEVVVNAFNQKYTDTVNFTLFSVENRFSIPSTLFFLSKMVSRFKNVSFVDKAVDMWNDVDILITTDPELLVLGAPWGKKMIKIIRPYNEHIKTSGLEVVDISDLIDNKYFEKLIKYKKQ